MVRKKIRIPGSGVFLDAHQAQREPVAGNVVVHVRIIEVEVQVAGVRASRPQRRGPAIAIDSAVRDKGNRFAAPTGGPHPVGKRQTPAGAFRHYRRAFPTAADYRIRLARSPPRKIEDGNSGSPVSGSVRIFSIISV